MKKGAILFAVSVVAMVLLTGCGKSIEQSLEECKLEAMKAPQTSTSDVDRNVRQYAIIQQCMKTHGFEFISGCPCTEARCYKR